MNEDVCWCVLVVVFWPLDTTGTVCGSHLERWRTDARAPKCQAQHLFFVSLLGVWTCFSLAKLEACCAIKGTREGLCFSMYHDENEAC